MQTYDWDAREVALDTGLLERVRLARLMFSDRLCQSCERPDPKLIEQLRSEAVYQMAEFLFSMKAYGIVSVEDLERFAEIHNDYIVSLTRDRAKLARLGLTEERALAAMFTADTKPRLLQNWADRPGAIDQSNLARFLVTIMSTETCRKVVIDLELGGFVARQRSAYGTILVWSKGRIEDLFGQMLRDLRRDVEGLSNS
ncbi:hypothetical protein [Chthonobacter rhizosphaerae]|uniref:hypothetical protein n=1 Tax=Chthonobacter rhizosphaerae TaxID=2735553 RepID=UPI0015EF7CFD|nr:hypothetical protein [Chthonobacter rhizosphaerae]